MSARTALAAKIIQKSWQDEEFKKELMSNPHKAIQKAFKVTIPETLKITVVEEALDHYYLVLPVNLDKLELSAEEMQGLASGSEYRIRPSAARGEEWLTGAETPETVGSKLQ